MLALWLLASHLVGDFVLQTRWQAAGKFGWTKQAISLRARHVVTYTLAFVPVVVWREVVGVSETKGEVFIVVLMLLHFLTDSRRFHSTLGDVVGWHWGAGAHGRRKPIGFADWSDVPSTPKNPWPALPLMIDQTLHVVQLAALAWLLT